MNEVRDLIIKEELIGEIKRLAEENQLYAENEVRFVKKILALNNKVANLHKVISKLQTKVARQKENITTLLHLYTSGKRSKSHKKLREKYRALNARIAELEAESERFTVHSDIERQDDKSPNDTQTQTIVYGKENEMRVFKDGNAWCFVLPDFQDLQVSSSVWMKEGVLDKIYKELRSVRNENNP